MNFSIGSTATVRQHLSGNAVDKALFRQHSGRAYRSAGGRCAARCHTLDLGFELRSTLENPVGPHRRLVLVDPGSRQVSLNTS